jgi:hypothetical protein
MKKGGTALQEFIELTKKMWELREKIESHEEIVKDLNKELTILKGKFIRFCEIEDLEKQHLPGFGTVSVTTEFSYKTPKTNEDKQAFASYCEEKEMFWDVFSVNSRTLQSRLKTELEIRESEGNFDPTFPGIEPPESYKKVNFRKGK